MLVMNHYEYWHTGFERRTNDDKQKFPHYYPTQ